MKQFGDQPKGLLVALAVIAGIVLLNAGPGVVPLLIIAGIIWFVVYRGKQPRVISTNHSNTMQSFDLKGLVSRLKRTGLLIVALLVGVVLLVNMIVIIPAGETGVYHLFGKVRDTEVHSGIHLINPLATIIPMSIRTEQYTMSIAPTEGQRLGDDSIESLTKEGLKVNLDMTVLYHLEEDRASDVYRELGIAYDEKLLRPQVRTAIRDVIATYDAKDIYSEKRDEAVRAIEERLSRAVNPRGIIIESVLLRNVSLPSMLTQAIESKLTAEQEAQRYDFVLQREEKEAERKRIEAAGQRDAQSIINQSLTSQYLQYLYIQNLEKREGTIYVPYDLPLLKGL